MEHINSKLGYACEELVKIYGLSATERLLIIMILQGYSPSEIAELRTRSLGTVRTQIKHIMSKVGVNKMNNLVLEVFKLSDNYQH